VENLEQNLSASNEFLARSGNFPERIASSSDTCELFLLVSAQMMHPPICVNMQVLHPSKCEYWTDCQIYGNITRTIVLDHAPGTAVIWQ
jgi:hypothetical protein